MAFFVQRRAKAGQKAGFPVMLKYFEIKKAFCYYIKQIDSMLPCVWFSNRSQKTSKCGKYISDTLGYASCATFLFLPHFDVICDLLLNRRTATWNLFVNYFSGSADLHTPIHTPQHTIYLPSWKTWLQSWNKIWAAAKQYVYSSLFHVHNICPAQYSGAVVFYRMGKRYHCEYCNRSFADTPHTRKNHINGVQHKRNRKLHYDSFKGTYAWWKCCFFVTDLYAYLYIHFLTPQL